MKITLQETTSSAIADQLVHLRDEGGAVALGRVFTLLVAAEADAVEDAIEAANAASREHPCRVIVIASEGPRSDPERTEDGLDAEIRVGRDAGASEIIVLRPRGGAAEQLDTLVMPLLLPDAPIVAWWPTTAPAVPSSDQLGRMAQRRITDVLGCEDPLGHLRELAENHAAGDTDLAWARATLWRGLLAAALDDVDVEDLTSITVTGRADHPSVVLLAAWLYGALGVPVTIADAPQAPALVGVTLSGGAGDLVLDRPVDTTILRITEPSGIHHRVSLPLRTRSDSLIEDLRRLDPDTVYEDVLTRGLPAFLDSQD
ncbi:glucose-6-phosphate dehydrogenase assembly protein OpcA [Serinibacter salmoneus]|uniref:Glucose-6-phosphate dehydrogenase assembly protein OpcA n=1 Tax=Serinibacter salmoneus TaxID=556530 RepID=A0A2A9D194_9MICO|nr:glucose-6-phosphate dehydrogenase assembly protein OpcA [Serinibacter salmoneus]PFG19722.1 glucose-6-phosphate dehydrogenase assembly protein OpcA [Serinibacter salmoneus]